MKGLKGVNKGLMIERKKVQSDWIDATSIHMTTEKSDGKVLGL